MDKALKVATNELALAVNSSDFFKAACQPGRFKEGSDNVITLRSQAEVPGLPTVALSEYDKPEAINVLVYHLYHPNTDYTTLAGDADMRLVLHAWVFAAAEKYNLKGLKLQAEHHTRTLLGKAPKDKNVQDQMAEAMAAIFVGTAETAMELRRRMNSALLSLLEKKTVEVVGAGLLKCNHCQVMERQDACGSDGSMLPKAMEGTQGHSMFALRVFKAACEPGRFKKGSENTITLRSRLESEEDDDDDNDALGCDDPEAINVLMYHLYHPSTKYRHMDDSGKGMTLALHVRVFAAADKYGLKRLQLQALDFAHEMMNQRNPDGELLNQMNEALKPIYTEAPETAISMRCSMNSVLWRNNGELLQSPLFQATIKAIPELAYELLMTKATEDFDKSMPPYCGCSDIDNSIFKCQDCGARKQLCRRHEREWNGGDDWCDMCDTGETKRLLHAWDGAAKS
ncbi:hypothetical protein KC330_g6946 [Hortaea werneckii]|nr:hypothetical protein KC330_g6946 [Hortaea werneckii]